MLFVTKNYAGNKWPHHEKMAISLTFDDADETQLDIAVPILKKYNLKATFYVLPKTIMSRIAEWKKVIDEGHEIGNHSMRHPCSLNFTFVGDTENALENYTIKKMSDELVVSNISINNLLGINPLSFAYPCGQNFIGRGKSVKSYVPLVAKYFLSGRNYHDESDNDPNFCDFAQLNGRQIEDDFLEDKCLIDNCLKTGFYMVLVGHKLYNSSSELKNKSNIEELSISAETFDKLCQYLDEHKKDIWTSTVTNVVTYMNLQKGECSKEHLIQIKSKHLEVMLSCILAGILFNTFLLRIISFRNIMLIHILCFIVLNLFLIWISRFGYIEFFDVYLLLMMVAYSTGALIVIYWMQNNHKMCIHPDNIND